MLLTALPALWQLLAPLHVVALENCTLKSMGSWSKRPPAVLRLIASKSTLLASTFAYMRLLHLLRSSKNDSAW